MRIDKERVLARFLCLSKAITNQAVPISPVQSASAFFGLLHHSATIFFSMVFVPRLINRFQHVALRTVTLAPASRIVRPVASGGRRIHSDPSQAQVSLQESSTDDISINEPPIWQPWYFKDAMHPDWRHPLFGLTFQEAYRSIFINIPHTATESDVEDLLKRAGLNR